MTGEAVSCIVVAGGKGERFGRDKLAEEIGGRSLLQRVVERVSQVSSEILLSVAPGRPSDGLPMKSLRVVADLYPGKSTLGGIYTGLVYSTTFRSLVVAADMPFLNTSLLRYLVEAAPGFDAVVPRLGGMLEPLHAVYSRRCIAPMEEQIKRDELRIRVLLDKVRTRYVEEEVVRRFDPDCLSFFNVNTANDLERARSLAAGVGIPGVDSENCNT